MSIADAVLELVPDSVLQFVLSSQEATPSATLELRHPDPTGPPIAFKVKTTQPRRYLVRPNQGLIASGQNQKVQIILVEKDKNSLLQSYQRLGQTALDHSKDKFLVQSVAILDPVREKQLKDYDQLTALWASVGTSTSTSAVANKKLHVRHTVAESALSASTPIEQNPTHREPIENLTADQLKNELGALRRKYDELVSFSVNLTAERDMLNNTLEQTKRDLSRELSKSVASDNARGRSVSSGGSASSGGPSLTRLLFFAALTLFAGIKIEQMGITESIPFVGSLLAQPNSDVVASEVPPVLHSDEPIKDEL